MKKLLMFAVALGILTAATAYAQADIVCTRMGCWETGTTIISNGGAYRGLTYKPRLHKDGKVREPRIIRTYE
jgi:hypothetical protein